MTHTPVAPLDDADVLVIPLEEMSNDHREGLVLFLHPSTEKAWMLGRERRRQMDRGKERERERERERQRKKEEDNHKK
jgi:hypothetical protein